MNSSMHAVSAVRRRATTLLATLVALLTAAAVVVPAPASAGPPPGRLDEVTVAPGIVRQHYRYQGDRGGVDVQVLRFRTDDARVEMRPELGKGAVPGMEATHEATTRLSPQGAIAGINASFFSWSGTPIGDPIGLFVRDGEYVSESQKGTIWRGAFGFTRSGDIVFDRPGYNGRMVLPADASRSKPEQVLPITGVNRWPKRQTADDPERREVTVFTPAYGMPTTGNAAGIVEVTFQDYRLDPTHTRTGIVASVRNTGNAPIPPNGIVVAASEAFGREIWSRGYEPGDQLQLSFATTPGWEDLWQAVQGGPMLLDDGTRTSASQWEREGFNPGRHSDARHPRTAVARTSGNELLLVTMDGRSTSSAGLSMRDAQTLLLHLGATDAVMMDGGGSTQMAVDNTVVNRPSDSAGFRRVATNIVLYSNELREPDVRRVGGGDTYQRAADIARTGWPSGSSTVLLASGWAFPDALAGGPLAAERDQPILLTRPDRLPSATLQAMRDLGTKDVVILGGPAAVSEDVEAQLSRAGIRPRRVFGADRVATAARIARILGAPTGRAFLVSADAWPDSASATVPAALTDSPMLLTWKDELHPQALSALRDMRVRDVVVAGGPAVVSEAVLSELRNAGFRVERVAGATRFETSAALATWSQERGGIDPRTAMLARADVFQDAIVAGPLGAKERKAVLLVDRLGLERSPATNGWLHAHDLASLTVIGDRTTMSSWLGYQSQLLLER
ncbi:MAG: cell wall-binding repeat-containing protein [Actinobacteria bacterium]|nr:cell wall-binding repeat-containing protein [Actinomycetota bacterium]